MNELVSASRADVPSGAARFRKGLRSVLRLALDFATGKRILRLLVDLKEKLGKTVLVITHNGAIAPVADRVVRLRSGQIVEVHRNAEPVPPEEVTW